MCETKSGVKWQPMACDEHGRVLSVRITGGELPLWQIVQVALDAEQVRVE